MKAIVVYQSKTGFTKKYAEWIAESLSCDISPINEAAGRLGEYDIIIYGGGIIAGKVSGFEKWKKDPKVSGKKCILFATGATNMDATHVIDRMRDSNLSSDEQKRIPFFFFESGINYDNMGFFSKTLLKGMCKSLQGKKNRTEEETGMMNALSSSSDHCNKAYIAPLVANVNSYR